MRVRFWFIWNWGKLTSVALCKSKVREKCWHWTSLVSTKFNALMFTIGVYSTSTLTNLEKSVYSLFTFVYIYKLQIYGETLANLRSFPKTKFYWNNIEVPFCTIALTKWTIHRRFTEAAFNSDQRLLTWRNYNLRFFNKFNHTSWTRSYGVMISALDSESSDPSWNLGGTWSHVICFSLSFRYFIVSFFFFNFLSEKVDLEQFCLAY